MDVETALNPEKHRLLSTFGFDRQFVRGDGVWLYDRQGRRFLDGYSQYGAVALGHNAAEPVAALRMALDSMEPAMVQPYLATWPEVLAQKLRRITPQGLSRCTFTSSGAEAVEAAIKLVRAKTQRPIILSAEGSFHGKTMGALAATGQSHYATGFAPFPPGFEHVPFGDADALEQRFLSKGHQIAGFLLEPIQGERGVILPKVGYLSRVRELCTSHKVPLILDEIQTGLGRTGRPFACDHEGVRPDVLLIAKALGGGIFPLGACLCTEEIWNETFALKHSSTFANNNLACCVGAAVIDTLESLYQQVENRGQHLAAGLLRLGSTYPRTIAAVRNKGLLGAIELRAVHPEDGGFLNYLDNQGLYSWAVASAIAERSSVLVLPTLGGGRVLRIAPPLRIDDEQLDALLDGVASTCSLLENGSLDVFARAVGALRKDNPVRRHEPLLPRVVASCPLERVPDYAFLAHHVDLDNIIATEPAFARLSKEDLRAYADFNARSAPGMYLQAPEIRSPRGDLARGVILSLGMLPEHMRRIGPRRVSEAITRAVDLAGEWGIRIVGLGAFTTPFSRRGLDVLGRGPAITTGNALTAGMAILAIQRVASRRGLDLADATLAVVGARGSVGMLCARLLARMKPRQLLLVGNPASGVTHLNRLREEIQTTHCTVRVTVDLQHLVSAQIVIAATGAAYPVLDCVAFNRGTLICDVARPYDTNALRKRPDLSIINGGLVQLPNPRARFGAGNLQNLPDGVQLACLSETILWALSGERVDAGVGDDVKIDWVDRVMALAQTHGFTLLEPPIDALDHEDLRSPKRIASVA